MPVVFTTAAAVSKILAKHQQAPKLANVGVLLMVMPVAQGQVPVAAPAAAPEKWVRQLAVLRAENRQLRQALKGRAQAAAFLKMKSRGRFHYRPDFSQVAVGEDIFDLRKRPLARWCLHYLYRRKAFGARSALHFADDIDPHVRELSGRAPRGIRSVAKIDNYFNDPQKRLPKLRKLLIHYDEVSGKYYLETRLAAFDSI